MLNIKLNNPQVDYFVLCKSMEKNNIEDFIPHRERMKLIEEIIEVNEKKAVTASTVNDKWPLYNNNSVDPIVMIELVAQTAGVAVAWERRNEVDAGVGGWLVGIKKANFSIESIPHGTRLITEVMPLYKHDTYGAFKGTVTNGQDVIGTVEIQAFRPE